MINKMDSDLSNLISSFRCNSDSSYTHSSRFGPASRYNISNHDISRFWVEYCSLTATDPDGKFGMAEKVGETCHIIANCTMKFFNKDYSEFQNRVPTGGSMNYDLYINKRFIHSVVYAYQCVIKELYNVGEMELTCVVLTKDNDEVIGDRVNSTFKLHFPYCRVNVREHDLIFRPKLLLKLRELNVTSKLRESPLLEWEHIIEPMLDSKGIPIDQLMYGSKNTEDELKLSLSDVYREIHIDDLDLEENEIVSEEFNELFLQRNHTLVQQGIMPDITFEDMDVFELIPFILSVDYWSRVSLLRTQFHNRTSYGSSSSGSTGPARSIQGRRRDTDNYAPVSLSEESDEDIACRFMLMIDPKRGRSGHFRRDIGQALYSVFKGKDKGLDMWINFVGNNCDQDEMEYDYHHEFISDNFMTLKTLAWYARLDNPEVYAEWHKEWTMPCMDQALSIVHADVAKALYRCYWLEFVCASVKNKSWFFFEDHKWIRLDQATELKKIISGPFLKMFENLRTKASQMVAETCDPIMKATGEASIKKYGLLISKLGNQSFKASLTKEAQENFHDSDFNSKLDRSPVLMGVMNGVIQVCETYACVRDGKPEDYISKCAPVRWKPDYTHDTPIVKELVKWFMQMFPDPELYNHALKLHASFLFGKNSNKMMPVYTGEGNNSKSMLKKILECVFGPYAVTLPTTILTGRRANSSGPNPELAQANGAHIAFVQEPDADDAMKGGIIKELTGGDSFFARFLNDNGGSVIASFTLILMCNKVPVIPNCDQAVKNRVRILPFLSKWVEKGYSNDEEVQQRERTFKLDKKFELKIPRMASAFLWLLINAYERYIAEGLDEPQIVKDHNRTYWEENDPYILFTKQCLEYVNITIPEHQKNVDGDMIIVPEVTKPDLSAVLTVREIVEEFGPWFRTNYPGVKVPQAPTIKHEFTRRMGPSNHDGWHGIRIKIIVPTHLFT